MSSRFLTLLLAGFMACGDKEDADTDADTDDDDDDTGDIDDDE